MPPVDMTNFNSIFFRKLKQKSNKGVSKNVMLSGAKHLYNALNRELRFFATLRMTINRNYYKIRNKS